MKSAIVIALLATLPAIAQTTPPTAAPVAANAAISGVVRDKATGTPLKDYVVSTYVNATWYENGITMTAATKQITATTDEHGQYRLSDLPAAGYRVMAQSPAAGGRLSMTRVVTLAGQDVEGVDFKFVQAGTITGKVLDENKEPVPNMFVTLVSKEYYLGSLGYFLKNSGRTNDQGEYKIAGVEAGHPFYLMADYRRQNLPAHAETPLNPQMRRRIPMRTWYLSSPDREGAASITLRPGEIREAVNIEVKKSPSYCMAGVASTPNGPAALRVSIEALTPSSGTSSSGGTFMAPTGTVTGPDGEFRFCDLFPGSYRVTVTERNQSPDSTFAITTITISDKDLTDLKFPTSPRVSLSTEVILDGPQPTIPITVLPRLTLIPLLRTQTAGEKLNVQPNIPGTLPMTGLLLDDYGVRATLNAPQLYIKDVTYAGRSVRFAPFHLGSAGEATSLQMTIGRDGGTITASVADKNGNPVADTLVVIIPAGTPNEGALAAQIISGQTDQTGHYTSRTLAPGKYFVVATENSYDMTPESIGKLWQSHARYQEVDLNPLAAAQVTLQPTTIR
jgi:hypothetical protein